MASKIRKEDIQTFQHLVERYALLDQVKDMTEMNKLVDVLSTSSSVYRTKLRPNLTEHNPLSLKEMLCMILIAAGKNPDQCADILGISVKSVNTYEQRIREKLKANHRAHALYLAQAEHYIVLID